MGENGNGNGNGNKVANAIRLAITVSVFILQLAGLLFAGAIAWSSVKSDLRDQATRADMNRLQIERDLARLEKMQLISDAWARDLDIRLAAAGIIVPRRQTIMVQSAPPTKGSED